jgi:hypothetical protein
VVSIYKNSRKIIFRLFKEDIHIYFPVKSHVRGQIVHYKKHLPSCGVLLQCSVTLDIYETEVVEEASESLGL